VRDAVTVTEMTADSAPPAAGPTAEETRIAEAATEEFVAVLQQLDDLIENRELDKARAELGKAVDRFGERADLQVQLARIEEADNRLELAMSVYARALMADPTDPGIAAEYCGFLQRLGLYRQDLDFIGSLPHDILGNPQIREALGAVYADAGWSAFAVDAYGPRRDLTPSARRRRLACWWMSGGPIPFLRRWSHAFDERARRNWYIYAEALSVFDNLDQIDGLNTTRIKADVDAYLESWAMIGTSVEVAQALVRHWVYRFPVSLAVAWAAVFMTLELSSPDKGAGETAVAASIAVAIAMLLREPLRWFANAARSAITLAIRSILPATVLIAVGTILITAFSAPPASAGIAGLALITTVGLTALGTLSLNTPAAVGQFRVNMLMRSRPRPAILKCLAELISQIDRPDLRNDLYRHGYWIRLLEVAARRIERDLPRKFPCRDPQTAEWMRERAAGAATALRKLKQHIAIPAPGSWDRLAISLRQDASALTSGNLGLMRWTQPPPPQVRRRSLLRWALTVAQRVLVAAAPVVVVFALQPVLNLTGTNLVLARVVTIFWAVFYIAISIDPTLVNKVKEAQDVFADIKSIGGPKSD
jgi:tetratricopeptide (TPR) repeat protein